MLPPQLSLSVAARPSILALTRAPRVAAAVTIASVHTASSESLQLYRAHNVQLARARHFHWWCRRSSHPHNHWARFSSTPQQPDSPEKSSRKEEPSADEKASGGRRQDEDDESSPRERYRQMRRMMIERMMRLDSYEGLFGASNRMLKGLNWREWSIHKELERDVKKWMSRLDQWENTKPFAEQKEARARASTDNQWEPEESKVERAPKSAQEEAKQTWEYDAISGRMVLKKGCEPSQKQQVQRSAGPKPEDQAKDWVDIPVKPYRPKVDASEIAKDASRPSGKTTVGVESMENQQGPPLQQSAPSVSEIDALSAEDVRAGMGQLKSSSTCSANQTSPCVTESPPNSRKTPGQLLVDNNSGQKLSGQHLPRLVKSQKDATLKLQFEQLEEAATYFAIHEKVVRKKLRALTDGLLAKSSEIGALKNRCDELAKEGISTVNPTTISNLRSMLQADEKVLNESSSLLAAAVLSAPRAPPFSTVAQHLQPSIERYAWDRKPFAKIRDAEQLVQNVEHDLSNMQDMLYSCWKKIQKKVRLASLMNMEMEGMKRSMRGIEEKWHKREDKPAADPSVAAQVTKSVIAAKAVESDPALSSIEKKSNEKMEGPEVELQGDNETSTMSSGAKSLENIPELDPASLDGGISLEPAENQDLMSELKDVAAVAPSLDSKRAESKESAEESVYTILALDPAMATITTATTSSSASAIDEVAMPLTQALQQLAQPAMFLSYLPKLKEQGFEPVKASENLLVLKKMTAPITSAVSGSTPAEGTASVVNSEPSCESAEAIVGAAKPEHISAHESSPTASQTVESCSVAERGMPPEAQPVYYSTKLQSPTPGTFQGLRPKRTEPVFSGTQGGYLNYRDFRAKLRQARQREWQKRKPWKRVVRFIRGALWVALMMYMIGAFVELNRRVDRILEKRRRRREARRAVDEGSEQ